MPITNSDLTRVRSHFVRSSNVGGGYLKSHINNAILAIDTLMTSTTITGGMVGSTIPQLVATAVNSGGYTFTPAQQKLLFALWAELKFMQDK